ncbi:MAG TPA: type II restriction endonuclease [Candidatus Nanoarchaeia archaeon]|nr:type II restriction endonuclease [Candidatus Nanoarchaeia archaeon]
MGDLVRIGSETAKGGFANEDIIVKKFNSWKKDREAKKWLVIMGYNIKEIRKVEAIKLHGHKTDVQIKVLVTLKKAISVQNISIKKANNDADYNQVDKRWVKSYKEMWRIPQEVVKMLMIFTGEVSPKQLLKERKITKQKYKSLRDKRRFFLDEFNEDRGEELLTFFRKNKMLIVTDIIKGNDKFAASWMLVTRCDTQRDETSWVLADINSAMNVFSQGEIKISPQGSLYIGRITMQRKGGDAGRKTANMLQFKIKPCDLFKD